MSEHAIELKDVTIQIGTTTVVEEVSFVLKHGSKGLLTGRSGSGKSTLFSAILGFVPIDKGEIYVDGVRLTPNTVWKIRSKIAYVPQEPRFYDSSVLEAIEAPFSYRANRHIEFDEHMLEELLQRFLLSNDILDKQINEISGGERQRIAIISAIMLQRSIFLLDETTSALDKDAAIAVARFFRDSNFSVLAITHEKRIFDGFDIVLELR